MCPARMGHAVRPCQSKFSTTTRREVTRGHLTTVSNRCPREEQTNPEANRRKEGRNIGNGGKEREGGREEDENRNK